jgi:CheY-like chemotaxis protein
MFDSTDVLAARILIVDDQDASVRLLERMLRRVGYLSVTCTTDPYQVCELHRKHRYDLIVLDLQMPGLDGFRVLAGLKEVEQEGYLSVLVMTAYPAHKQRALDAGAKDFVSKPLKPVEVMTRVHNLLELRLLHRRDRGLKKPPPAAPTRTVLYVEDNAANLKLVEQLIARRPDLRLLSAQDGSLGVALARASQPEVVLMDINLPGITGTRALEMLREDPSTARIPVVALSAHSSARDVKKGLAAGFLRYLGKPLQIAEFTEALDAALSVAEQRALVESDRTVTDRAS